MARGENGYITVTAGMPDPGARRPVAAERRLSRGELCELAVKLRRQGWSYRRVSAELRVDYSTIRRWLDGDAPMAVPVVNASHRPKPLMAAAPAVPAAVPDGGRKPPAAAFAGHEDLIAENRRLAERIEHLVRVQEAQVQTMSGLEDRLLNAMEAQHRSLFERLVQTIKSLFPRGAASG